MNRVQKHARAVELLSYGYDRKTVAVTLGVSYSGLATILNDPDGSKQNDRRERYRGTCARCGGKTDGSNGFKGQPIYCAPCAAIVQHENKRWTKQAVIEAIQLWASEHDGEPPVATDWMRSGRGRRFPPLGCVYKANHTPNAPFSSWAEAIEAAGFPRPGHGRRRKKAAA